MAQLLTALMAYYGSVLSLWLLIFPPYYQNEFHGLMCNYCYRIAIIIYHIAMHRRNATNFNVAYLLDFGFDIMVLKISYSIS